MVTRKSVYLLGLFAIAAGLLSACVNPTHSANTFAEHMNFEKQIEPGSYFRHVVYRNARTTPNDTLHVYIEGDGTPYWEPDLIATDPTPRNPLMLRLMALDAAPSIFLGRPCYFALYRDRACAPLFWTLRRYGPEVLDSMESVLRSQIQSSGATRIELIGHSGGGTLAVLLAQRINSVSHVVTIGANLDIDAWCELHHFTPLLGSLNPSDQPPQRKNLQTTHWVGQNDTNTPPALLQTAAYKRGEAVRVIPNFDHNCCWEKVWRNILSEDP